MVRWWGSFGALAHTIYRGISQLKKIHPLGRTCSANVDICSPFITWMKEHYLCIPSPVFLLHVSNYLQLQFVPVGFKLILILTNTIINHIFWWNFMISLSKRFQPFQIYQKPWWGNTFKRDQKWLKLWPQCLMKYMHNGPCFYIKDVLLCHFISHSHHV